MRSKTRAVCQQCGATTPRWVGRCPECEEWGSVVEETVERRTAGAAVAPELVPLDAHDTASLDRLSTGLDEVNGVLGGGLVRGSVVLLAGEPGIGKSTLILQAVLELSATSDVVLVCGEESPAQVRARAARVGGVRPRTTALADPSLPSVLATIASGRAAVVVVDSIQTVFDPDIPSAPGSVSQVRECGSRLARAARDAGVTLILVGHVTKEGAVAGPRVLEHIVDVVLHFEGDRSGGVRILRALKNRFGSTEDVGFFEMADCGLVAIRDASAHLLADRCPGLAGSALAAVVDGRRPFVCEIQALVASGSTGPRPTGLGVDPGRLSVLAAVVQNSLEVSLTGKDVFVSAVGGLSALEPAVDLPMVLALLSAANRTPLPPDLVAFGEVGLGGEIRRVPAADRRLAEARHIGALRAVVPEGTACAVSDIDVIPVRKLVDVQRLIASANV